MDDRECWLLELIRIVDSCPDREGLKDTPKRIIESLNELAAASKDDGNLLFEATFDAGAYDNWVVLDSIPFSSLCEHHMIPFVGTVSIAYWPRDGRVIGLSKLVRLVDCMSKRLQLQERLTVELAEKIYLQLRPKAVEVSIEAEHLCMVLRGVKKCGIVTRTKHRCGAAAHWPL
jgi:GTP cyclohydrolase I